MRSLLAALLLATIVGTVFTGMRVTNLAVKVDGRDLRITWEMTDQAGVRHFDVERANSDRGPFMRLNTSDIRPRTDRKYEYVDRSAFKEEDGLYYYRIAIIENNGSVHYSHPEAALDKPSTVHRTWGSIKSMFR
jgi:hypothetical protein